MDGCAKELPLDVISENNIQQNAQRTGDTAQLRIMQYNVKNCVNGDNIDEIADEILREAPQVVCLQELDYKSKRSNGKEILKLLAEEVSMNYAFYPAINFQGGLYGVGIMSVYPIESCQNTSLEVGKGEEGRTLAKAQITVNGITVDIFNTHLSFESLQSRQNQLSFINNAVIGSKSFVLCGDFNIGSYSELDAIKNVQAVNNQNTNYETFIQGDDESSLFLGIDNIIVSGDAKIINSKMEHTSVSDHNYLVADVSFSG